MRPAERKHIGKLEHACTSLARAVIAFYRILISPVLPMSCRFSPTCSDYTQQAIKKHGMLKGSMLGLRRILRCHPLGGSGMDPVP
jgi:putative membrane protein insertion efficiency factor